MRSAESRQSRSAYTLLELVAVMVILALMLGVGFVNLDSMVPRFEIDREVNDIALALRDARNRAMVMGVSLRAEIDPARNVIDVFRDEYDVYDDYTATEDDKPLFSIPWAQRVLLQRATIGRDEALSEGKVVVLKFWPSGLCTPVRLYFQHTKNKGLVRTVQLNPLTGLTTVYDEAIEPESYEIQVTAPQGGGRRS